MLEKLFLKMYEYYSGDSHQIQHFVKVHSFAKQIGILEDLDEEKLMTLEVAAIVHDIGIKVSMEKYGISTGNYQEIEGPPIAEKILSELGYTKEIIDRVSYLVGHHHTYMNIDGLDYQILIEADFLVNIHENSMNKEQIVSILEKIFRTSSGIKLCKMIFNV
ncbi:HD domain-containing protein [Fusobacterium sp. PH5-44]|uniref:HD domain-containing protein n=1 Tax=unclassified Fusobacterium TaxID=2648384 RepID=UPI003D24AB47